MASPNITLLNDLFALARAGRYSLPENQAAALPVVYGDLTDGAEGVWTLPQIDTTAGAKVFCFAGHPVLSVGDGNAVTLYDNDGVIPGGEYTFSESNDFQSFSSIATVTFSTDPNGPVKARGKGKATGATLIENPIAVVEDVLLNIVGLGSVASDVFDTTGLEDARSQAGTAGYKAAGVIQADFTPGQLIQQVLASFMGSWFLRKDRKIFIRLETDPDVTGQLPGGEAMAGFIVPRRRGEAFAGPRRREEIINTPAASYRFNYAGNAFFGFDDGTAKQDAKSAGVHGALGRPEGPFAMTWIRDLTTLQAVQAVIVNLFKSGPRIFEIESLEETLLGLERGDHVSVSLDFVKDPEDGSDLANQICRVLSKSYDYERASVRLRLLDTGLFLTTGWKADGTVKADGSRKAGGERDKVLRG